MKKLFITLSLCCCLIATMMPTAAFASEDTGQTVTIVADNGMNATATQKKIENALSNPNIEEVVVLFDDKGNEGLEAKALAQPSQITPKTTSSVYYLVKNVKQVSDYYGKTVLAFAEGGPGDSLTVSKGTSVSTTISGTLGASYKSISAAVGWSVTGSTSLTISGQATVPKKHNNKAVKRMRLNAHSVYKVKEFDVYRYVPGYTNKKLGRKNTKKAYGVSFTKSYTYK